MGLVPYIQAALTLVLTVVTFIVLAAVRSVRGDVSKLLGAFQKKHRYSDPSGAAVVTPSPSPGPVGELAPASAQRVGLEAAPPASGSHRASQPVIGLSRPFKPSPSQVAQARALEAAPHSETPEQIRARLEAAEDQREKARAADEAFGDDDEQTVVQDAKGVRAAIQKAKGAPPPPTPIAARRAMLLGVPAERTVSDPKYRARFGSNPTLVSEGVTPPPSSEPRLLPLDRLADLPAEELARVDALAAAHHVSREAMLAILADAGLKEAEARALTLRLPEGGRRTVLPPPTLSVRVERRWHELLATAQAQGEHAEHCMGSVCLRDGFTVGVCPCECEGCALVKSLLARAKRESGE